jgi:hypothetical protein
VPGELIGATSRAHVCELAVCARALLIAFVTSIVHLAAAAHAAGVGLKASFGDSSGSLAQRPGCRHGKEAESSEVQRHASRARSQGATTSPTHALSCLPPVVDFIHARAHVMCAASERKTTIQSPLPPTVRYARRPHCKSYHCAVEPACCSIIRLFHTRTHAFASPCDVHALTLCSASERLSLSLCVRPIQRRTSTSMDSRRRWPRSTLLVLVLLLLRCVILAGRPSSFLSRCM